MQPDRASLWPAQGGDTDPLFFISLIVPWRPSRKAGARGPARPIPARTPRAGWVAYLWCGFCALPTPRGPRPHPAAGTRLPAVAGMDHPARLSAQKLQASAAWTICNVFAHFPLVRAPSATSSPNLVARRVSRRLPLMRSENRACFGGYRGLGPLIAGEQPKLCRSAAGNPSSRSLRSNGRHSDGSATAPPDSAPFRSYFRATMRCECMCGCAGRSHPSHSHLASPVICRERASRRERDGSMQSQPGAARATVRACRMCKYKHPAFRIRMVNRASS